jgi:hypothetical protein
MLKQKNEQFLKEKAYKNNADKSKEKVYVSKNEVNLSKDQAKVQGKDRKTSSNKK